MCGTWLRYSSLICAIDMTHSAWQHNQGLEPKLSNRSVLNRTTIFPFRSTVPTSKIKFWTGSNPKKVLVYIVPFCSFFFSFFFTFNSLNYFTNQCGKSRQASCLHVWWTDKCSLWRKMRLKLWGESEIGLRRLEALSILLWHTLNELGPQNYT